MAIDIGPEATDRVGGDDHSYTVILLDNPANASGKINSIEVWAVTNITGLRVGTFYLISGLTYKCRDSVLIGDVAAGAKRVFTAPTDFAAFNVVAGDFIGSYYTGGSIEAEAAGAGQVYIEGEYIDPGDQATFEAFALADSLYGTGIEIVAPTVTTQAVSSIGTTTATGNGNITDTGGENCTRRGFCYMEGTSGDPTTADSVAYDDGDFGAGAYTKGLTGLSSGTNYRVRAYAVNTAGTGYGATVQMRTITEQAVGGGAVAIAGSLNRKTLLTVGQGAITISGSLGRKIKLAIGQGAVAISSKLGWKSIKKKLRLAPYAYSSRKEEEGEQ